jgi:hypothetical protein
MERVVSVVDVLWSENTIHTYPGFSQILKRQCFNPRQHAYMSTTVLLMTVHTSPHKYAIIMSHVPIGSSNICRTIFYAAVNVNHLCENFRNPARVFSFD